MPAIQESKGTPDERGVFTEVSRHYDMATEDLDARRKDWNTKDELFRSHINDSGDNKWPYSAKVFDPRVFTSIFEKSARLLANKPRGRMVPRERGDVVGARINNEILNFQWDDAERVDEEPMLAKWARMDMNARKYGASFARVSWHFERRLNPRNDKTQIEWFNGPKFEPWNNRDVLHNPSYSSIRNWVQLREYVTVDELTQVNDAAQKKPIYKNLDILREALRKEGSHADTRAQNWVSRNLSIKGLQDFLGRDEYFKTVELVTEYRPDRWITFAPTHGVILRDIPNPYRHGRIPVVMLKYYPIDEDIYGLSEIEPIEKLQKAVNALVCQYLDAINMSLYTPVKVRTAAVQMHTLEFGPGKKWLMNDPTTDVLPYETSVAGVSEFGSTYRFMIGAMQEALGETSAAVSRLAPGEQERTATEIRELTSQRNVRDNFNQIFLHEAIKDQMMLWYQMNQQFLMGTKKGQDRSIRIVGRDAVEFFQNAGLDEFGFGPGVIERITSDEFLESVENFSDEEIEALVTPLFPVSTPQGEVPKFEADQTGESGTLRLEPEDLSGVYDYIPDVRSMANPEPAKIQALIQMIAQAKDPASVQIRAQEGVRLKLHELEQDFFETLGLKDASKYYEPIQEGEVLGGEEPIQRGRGRPNTSRVNIGTGQEPGVGEGLETLAGGQATTQLA